MKKLKPIMFIQSDNNATRNNIFQQNVLLKALSYTSDIDELKEIAKFHSRTEVLKTLDKLVIRKEYHAALERNGLDLDTIVKRLRDICLESASDKVALGAIQLVLKSIGLEKYETSETENKNWEDVLLKIAETEKKTLPSGKIINSDDYEVKQPEIPDRIKKKKEDNRKLESELYE